MQKLLLLFLLTQSLAGAAAPLNAATQASSVVESNISSKPEPAPQITLEQYNEIYARLRGAETAVLESQRKSIDWWFGALAILTTIVAALGALLPYLMGRKDKKLLQSELQNARDLVASIKTHEKEAKDLTVNLKKFASGTELTPEQKISTRQDAEDIINDPKASEVDKLQARAVLASQHEKPTREQAINAFELWNALSLIREHDASVHANAGYWAQKLFEQSKLLERVKWFDTLQKHYAQALAIKQNMHEAAFNWGVALTYQAEAVQKTNDLSEARLLWDQASQKYDQALAIKSNMHKAARNLGGALISLYQLTAPSNSTEADTYLNRAIALLEKHSAMSREEREVFAYNLACAYSLQGRAVDAVAQLDICISANKLAPHWRDEKDFEPIRHTPEFLTWVEKNFPETTTAPT